MKEFFNVEVKREDLKDYFDWIKSLVTICSAAVATLLYKFNGIATTPIKISATAFVIALVMLCVTFAGFIEHKHSATDNLRVLTKFFLAIGIISFLFGIGALVAQLY